jgi:hypothetical protein
VADPLLPEGVNPDDPLPEGVRGEVVAALAVPLSRREFAEAALNSTEQERELAATMSGKLADLRGRQAVAVLWLIDVLRPYLRHDLDRPLMDVIADAPPEVREQAVKILDVFDP